MSTTPKKLFEIGVNDSVSTPNDFQIPEQGGDPSADYVKDMFVVGNKPLFEVADMLPFKFDVWPNDVLIPTGAVGLMDESVQTKLKSVYGEELITSGFVIHRQIPSQMIEIFHIQTHSTTSDCDVIVDWGDGSEMSVVKNITWIDTPTVGDATAWSRNYESESNMTTLCFAHKYETSKRYTITIYGRNYIRLMHCWSGSGRVNNLVCGLFGADGQFPWFWTNVSSAFFGASRVLSIDASYTYPFRFTKNHSSALRSMPNCVSIKGLGGEKSSTSLGGMMAECYGLNECEYAIPSSATSIAGIFEHCYELATKIEDLINSPFTSTEVSVERAFRYCYQLNGTVPGKYLWDNGMVKWDVYKASYISSWDEETTYVAGDKVKLNGVCYEAKENDNPNVGKNPKTESEYWEKKTYAAFITDWDSTIQYYPNYYVLYNGTIYKALKMSKDANPETSTSVWTVDNTFNVNTNVAGPFFGCSSDIRSQVPLSWGGSNESIVEATYAGTVEKTAATIADEKIAAAIGTVNANLDTINGEVV